MSSICHILRLTYHVITRVDDIILGLICFLKWFWETKTFAYTFWSAEGLYLSRAMIVWISHLIAVHCVRDIGDWLSVLLVNLEVCRALGIELAVHALGWRGSRGSRRSLSFPLLSVLALK